MDVLGLVLALVLGAVIALVLTPDIVFFNVLSPSESDESDCI